MLQIAGISNARGIRYYLNCASNSSMSESTFSTYAAYVGEKGRWKIIGGTNTPTWFVSGYETPTEKYENGTYYICFLRIQDFYLPPIETRIIANNNVTYTNFYHLYTNSLSVVITGLLVGANGYWHLSSFPNEFTNATCYANNTGVTYNGSVALSTIPKGTYSLAFEQIRGYYAIPATNVNITGASETWYSTNYYIAYSNSLAVFAAGVTSGSNVVWTLNAANSEYTNTIVSNGYVFTNNYILNLIPTGSYSITWPTMPGYTTPAVTTTNITESSPLVNIVTGLYVPVIWGNNTNEPWTNPPSGTVPTNFPVQTNDIIQMVDTNGLWKTPSRAKVIAANNLATNGSITAWTNISQLNNDCGFADSGAVANVQNFVKTISNFSYAVSNLLTVETNRSVGVETFSLSNVIYVAKNGSDAEGNGNILHPYQTIQKAINTIPQGTLGRYVIEVSAGEYTENLVFTNSQCLRIDLKASVINGDVSWHTTNSISAMYPTLIFNGAQNRSIREKMPVNGVNGHVNVIMGHVSSSVQPLLQFFNSGVVSNIYIQKESTQTGDFVSQLHFMNGAYGGDIIATNDRASALLYSSISRTSETKSMGGAIGNVVPYELGDVKMCRNWNCLFSTNAAFAFKTSGGEWWNVKWLGTVNFASNSLSYNVDSFSWYSFLQACTNLTTNSFKTITLLDGAMGIATTNIPVNYFSAGSNVQDALIGIDSQLATIQGNINGVGQAATNAQNSVESLSNAVAVDITNLKGATNALNTYCTSLVDEINNGSFLTNSMNVAIGSNAFAQSNSVAIGTSVTATNMGIAIGNLAIGSQSGIGIGSQANGRAEGHAVGNASQASSYGVAVGGYANGMTYGVAVGRQAKGSSRGVALGYNADGYTYGVGIGNSANGSTYGVAVGASSWATSNSVAIGFGVSNPVPNSTMIKGDLTMQGNRVTNASYYGNGIGLTNIPESAVVLTGLYNSTNAIQIQLDALKGATSELNIATNSLQVQIDYLSATTTTNSVTNWSMFVALNNVNMGGNDIIDLEGIKFKDSGATIWGNERAGIGIDAVYTNEVAVKLNYSKGVTNLNVQDANGNQFFYVDSNGVRMSTLKISGNNPTNGANLIATNTLGQAKWSAPVGFGVYLAGTFGFTGTIERVVIWDSTNYNINNCFNGGTFTAPVNGLYHFSAVNYGDAGNFLDNVMYKIYVNDTQKTFGQCGKGIAYAQSYETYLTNGATVSLRVSGATANQTNSITYGEMYNNFGGHLIQELP
jgi:hypothetical protein